MNDKDATDCMALLVVTGTGWNDQTVDVWVDMMASRWSDHDAARTAVQQVADTHTGYGHPSWATVHNAYQAAVRRAVMSRPALPQAPSRTLTMSEAREVVARAYAKQCGLRDPLTDPHIRSGWRTTEPNPEFLDRMLGLRPAWTDDETND